MYAERKVFAAGERVVVGVSTPSRDHEVLRNALVLSDTGSGTLIGRWEEDPLPQGVQPISTALVAVDDRTVITVGPDGGLQRWTVSPDAWQEALCGLVGEASADEVAQLPPAAQLPLCPG